MADDRGHKINTYIPEDMWQKVIEKGIESPSVATNQAFTAWLMEDEITASFDAKIAERDQIITELKGIVTNLEEKLENCEKLKQDIITSKQKLIVSLHSERDQLEDAIRLQNSRIDDLQKTVVILRDQLQKANDREEGLKQTHDNYMAQMQTVISSRLLESPKEKVWWKIWK